MSTRLAGTIFELGYARPVILCAGAVLLGTALAMLQDTLVACWRIAMSEDIDVDICERHLSLLPDLRGSA